MLKLIDWLIITIVHLLFGFVLFCFEINSNTVIDKLTTNNWADCFKLLQKKTMYILILHFDHMLTWQVESSQTKDQAALWDDTGGMSHYIPRLWRPVWTSSVMSPNYCSKQRQKEMACKVLEGVQVLLHQIKSLFSLLPPTLPSIFLDSHLGLSLSL